MNKKGTLALAHVQQRRIATVLRKPLLDALGHREEVLT